MINHCAAPWVESVLFQNGEVKVCCRNPLSMGNWYKQDLKDIWHSGRFQEFRRMTRLGKALHPSCEMCRANGTIRWLRDELHGPFKYYKAVLSGSLGERPDSLDVLEKILVRGPIDGDAAGIVDTYEAELKKLRAGAIEPLADEVRQAFEKLILIGLIARSYLSGDSAPPVVMPFRQVNLISGCNARCIHCPGNFSGEIRSGAIIAESEVHKAFAYPDNIISFFMNGSEFLLYKTWKDIALLLMKHGIRLDISTNSILLSNEAIDFLIDNRIINNLNISIDGARKDTVEAIRTPVSFEHLQESARYLFKRSSQSRFDYFLSFSFVLMKRNYRELPELVRLVNSWKSGNDMPLVSVNCQALENFPIAGYSDFVRQEHHSLIPREELIGVFREAQNASLSTGIPVYVFYSHTLQDFIDQGCPFPPLWEANDSKLGKCE